MPVARKLDFIVTGTGRSGTSAVARYLSAVRGVHCGLELFSPWSDHGKLEPPGCFTDLTKPDLPRGMRKPSPVLLNFSLSEIERRQSALRYFGNKTPNYIFRLKGLLDELEPSRAIVCWRDVRSVAKSYARRADDPDDSWDPGKRAIFAAADTAVCIRSLASLGDHDVLIVPNRVVVADWESATHKMISYILPELTTVEFDPVNLAAITKRLSAVKPSSRSVPVWSTVEEEAIAAIEQTNVDGLLNRSEPFMLSEVLHDLKSVSAKLPADLFRFVENLVAQDGRPEMEAYVPKWLRMAHLGQVAHDRRSESGEPSRSARHAGRGVVDGRKSLQ